jgi:hypothetical protein
MKRRRPKSREGIDRDGLRGRPLAWSLAAALFLGGVVEAQVVNPADKARDEGTKGEAATAQSAQGPPPAGTAPEKHLRSFELPPVKVIGEEPAALKEEELIGPNQQPRWTAHRRFSETRIYVAPPGTFEFEFWLIPEIPRKGPANVKTQFEFEMGLPYRFQVDLYAVADKTGNQGGFSFDEEKLEARWAFADWGKIPGNPTLYLEWALHDMEPDSLEMKLLLGDQIAPRWHWGANLVYERELGAAGENNYEINTGVSYAVVDTLLSVGVEEKFAFADEKGSRGTFTTQVLVGPSFQIRPVPQAHFDFAPLIGLTGDAPRAELFFVLGWEF